MALRGDLALQIARHVERGELTQSAAASRLGIPQPTLSKIVRGQVESLSLELLLRVAMRAGLSVVLQTGKDPAEAGVYLAAGTTPASTRIPSKLGEYARAAANDSLRTLSPKERLKAQLTHIELVTALHRAGSRVAGNHSRRHKR